MSFIDLNCDMGESFGRYKLGSDEEILQYVSSANIACGFHAGDPATMRKTVKLAMENGVAIGAHPGLQDRVGFGRRRMELSPQEAYDLVVYQIGGLAAFIRSEGGSMQHVKAHGALYNMAAENTELAEAVAEAVYRIDPELILFGLANSELLKAGARIGLRTGSEVFADRSYQHDGLLTARDQPAALIAHDEDAAQQVIRMVREKKVRTTQGSDIEILAETVCIHGDGPHALSFARKIQLCLLQAGIEIKSIAHFK